MPRKTKPTTHTIDIEKEAAILARWGKRAAANITPGRWIMHLPHGIESTTPDGPDETVLTITPGHGHWAKDADYELATLAPELLEQLLETTQSNRSFYVAMIELANKHPELADDIHAAMNQSITDRKLRRYRRFVTKLKDIAKYTAAYEAEMDEQLKKLGFLD